MLPLLCFTLFLITTSQYVEGNDEETEIELEEYNSLMRSWRNYAKIPYKHVAMGAVHDSNIRGVLIASNESFPCLPVSTYDNIKPKLRSLYLASEYEAYRLLLLRVEPEYECTWENRILDAIGHFKAVILYSSSDYYILNPHHRIYNGTVGSIDIPILVVRYEDVTTKLKECIYINKTELAYWQLNVARTKPYDHSPPPKYDRPTSDYYVMGALALVIGAILWCFYGCCMEWKECREKGCAQYMRDCWAREMERARRNRQVEDEMEIRERREHPERFVNPWNFNNKMRRYCG